MKRVNSMIWKGMLAVILLTAGFVAGTVSPIAEAGPSPAGQSPSAEKGPFVPPLY